MSADEITELSTTHTSQCVIGSLYLSTSVMTRGMPASGVAKIDLPALKPTGYLMQFCGTPLKE